ncbi:MAG: hypothetical protein HY015_08270 [Bacteroidetes bacterium]|nr:hypothetical protein [Bacteroidota bacterium]MBI3482951.1 hypothetical protein [Bacteroidota bacterium]
MPSEQHKLLRQLLWLIAFSIAMGFLEAAVVVYLRLLYYPNGFEFPLVPLDERAGVVEILREAATVVMLIGVGVLAGKNPRQRLAFFLLAFAIWDLFYYVFLKVILDWPSSWLTWDILFLIPAPWVGPVLSAVIASITMIIFASAILHLEFQNQSKRINGREWTLIALGSLAIILSWMWDYIKYSGRLADVSRRALEALSTYIPDQFNWWLFLAGEMLLLVAVFLYWRRR